MHLSNKKRSTSPISLNAQNLVLMKQLFWIKLAKQIKDVKMLINIYESWFSRETWQNYSWLKTGKSWSITSLVFNGSINTILWITTHGEVINMFKYIPSNSNNFIKFFKICLWVLRRKRIKCKKYWDHPE